MSARKNQQKSEVKLGPLDTFGLEDGAADLQPIVI